MSLVLNFSKAGLWEHMSFVDHLEELRGHIVRSLLAVLLMGIILFFTATGFSTT